MNVCSICQKEIDFHSETESTSCMKKLNERVKEMTQELEEMFDK